MRLSYPCNPFVIYEFKFKHRDTKAPGNSNRVEKPQYRTPSTKDWIDLYYRAVWRYNLFLKQQDSNCNNHQFMDYRFFFIAAACLCLNLIPLPSSADTVFLKNGKELKVEKAWQENGEVWIVLSDMKASIPLSKVIRIEADPSIQPRPASRQSPNNSKTRASQPRTAVDAMPAQTEGTARASTVLNPANPSADQPLVLKKNGLANMKWGTILASVRGLEEKETDTGLQDVVEYIRPADSLKLGGAGLKTVIYAFWRNQIYTVSIWTEGRQNYLALRDAAVKQFGKGTRIDGSDEKYLWSNAATDAMLKYSGSDRFGLLWMRDKKLDRKIKLSRLNRHTSYLKQLKSNF